ncbi:MAG: hypothetical protein HONBIEJF_02235 [Fimbriimonadaceae bacterium]|nr:hypothetical protein [Fimbriimonadaceae bacterium]
MVSECDNKKGLQTSATYYHQADGDNDWETEHTENYAYEAERDFLTGVHYTGGTPGTDWSYDPAGNRANSGYSYDNLNRMTASPGYSYDNHPGALSDADVLLGSRKWRNYGSSGAMRYVYDVLNRVSSVCSSTSGATYAYRADGMRIKKVEGLTISWVPGEGEEEGYYNENWTTDKPTTRYWYDGQMPCSEDFTRKIDGVTTVDQTQYGLGARGIDYIRVSRGSTVLSESYPIYDGHGNMIAQIDKSGTLSNQRLYDVWGGVRSGSTTGEPSQRYCANLGHKLDDESGLIYMRARYYEPGTGRFISEDRQMEGINWYAYSENNPVSNVDPTGNSNEKLYMAGLGLLLFFLAAGGVIAGTVTEILKTTSGKIMLATGVIFLATWFADVIVPDSAKSSDELYYRWAQFANNQLAGVLIALMYASLVFQFNRSGFIREMWGIVAAQALILAAFLAFDAVEQAM